MVLSKESPNPFYGKLKILKLSDLHKFEIAKLVHDFLHDKLPVFSVFSHLFQKSSQIFDRFTKSIVQTKTNCIFRFVALTACNVALGIRVISYEIQYLWKYNIFRNKSNSKNVFCNFTSDDELGHLLLHFTRAIGRLKDLNENLAFFLRSTILFELPTYRVAALTQ